MCVWHAPSLPTPLVVPGNSLRIGPQEPASLGEGEEEMEGGKERGRER